MYLCLGFYTGSMYWAYLAMFGWQEAVEGVHELPWTSLATSGNSPLGPSAATGRAAYVTAAQTCLRKGSSNEGYEVQQGDT